MVASSRSLAAASRRSPMSSTSTVKRAPSSRSAGNTPWRPKKAMPSMRMRSIPPDYGGGLTAPEATLCLQPFSGAGERVVGQAVTRGAADAGADADRQPGHPLQEAVLEQVPAPERQDQRDQRPDQPRHAAVTGPGRAGC